MDPRINKRQEAAGNAGRDGSLLGHADGPRPENSVCYQRSIPPKLYRVGELVEYAGVSRQTIHNYTVMGLLRETRRTRGGHRLYDERTFARLDGIAALRRQNRSIAEIRKHFATIDKGQAGGCVRGRRA
ncbi:MAG: MerR family transcriptional regulator [Planctomycetota bacterium]